MNQAPTRLCEFVKLIAGFRLKPMKQIPKRKDSFQPQINPDRINNGVVNHDGNEETLP